MKSNHFFYFLCKLGIKFAIKAIILYLQYNLFKNSVLYISNEDIELHFLEIHMNRLKLNIFMYLLIEIAVMNILTKISGISRISPTLT